MCPIYPFFPATFSGLLTSAFWSLNFLFFAKWLRLPLAPVMKLSTVSTSHPSASSLSQRCDPRNPAPPVTTARMHPPQQISPPRYLACFPPHPFPPPPPQFSF